MTERQARELLEKLLVAAQKVRSNIMEKGWDENDIAFLNPWLGGDHNIIIGLTKALLRPHIEPIDVYNFLVIVEETPALKIWCELKGIELPALSAIPLSGFEREVLDDAQ